MEQKKKVFVIMPFSDDFFEAYEMIKNHFSDSFEFSHAGEEDNQQNILADIIPPIYRADIILADLTGLNANVMYELGVAHTLNKKTIVITRDELSSLPFDLKQYRTKQYTTNYKSFFELLEYLKKNFNGAIDNTVTFSNPVADFLKAEKATLESVYNENSISVAIPDGEKGFLDFLAEIEEDVNAMNTNIIGMNQHISDMNDSTNKSTAEINRVKANGGGNGQNAFMRKQARKVAESVSLFSSQLKEHNSLNFSLWNRIETNTLGLIENPFSTTDGNRDSLVKFLQTFIALKASMGNSKVSIENLKNVLEKQIMGLERSLNQAIRFLSDDLTTYLAFVDQAQAGIDRILNKSKFIIGEFDAKIS